MAFYSRLVSFVYHHVLFLTAGKTRKARRSGTAFWRNRLRGRNMVPNRRYTKTNGAVAALSHLVYGIVQFTNHSFPSPRPSGERVRVRGFYSKKRHLTPSLSPASRRRGRSLRESFLVVCHPHNSSVFGVSEAIIESSAAISGAQKR